MQSYYAFKNGELLKSHITNAKIFFPFKEVIIYKLQSMMIGIIVIVALVLSIKVVLGGNCCLEKKEESSPNRHLPKLTEPLLIVEDGETSNSPSSEEFIRNNIQPCTFGVLATFNVLFLICTLLTVMYNTGMGGFLPISKHMLPIVNTYDFVSGQRYVSSSVYVQDVRILKIIGGLTFFSISITTLWSNFVTYDILFPPKLEEDKKPYWCGRTLFKVILSYLTIVLCFFLYFHEWMRPIDGIDIFNLIWFDERRVPVEINLLVFAYFAISTTFMIFSTFRSGTRDPNSKPLQRFLSAGCIFFLLYVIRFAFLCFPSLNVKCLFFLVPLQVTTVLLHRSVYSQMNFINTILSVIRLSCIASMLFSHAAQLDVDILVTGTS
jgi:hypothetical protein